MCNLQDASPGLQYDAPAGSTMAKVDVSVVALHNAWQVDKVIEGTLISKVIADVKTKLLGEWNPRKSNGCKQSGVRCTINSIIVTILIIMTSIFNNLHYIGI